MPYHDKILNISLNFIYAQHRGLTYSPTSISNTSTKYYKNDSYVILHPPVDFITDFSLDDVDEKFQEDLKNYYEGLDKNYADKFYRSLTRYKIRIAKGQESLSFLQAVAVAKPDKNGKLKAYYTFDLSMSKKLYENRGYASEQEYQDKWKSFREVTDKELSHLSFLFIFENPGYLDRLVANNVVKYFQFTHFHKSKAESVLNQNTPRALASYISKTMLNYVDLTVKERIHCVKMLVATKAWEQNYESLLLKVLFDLQDKDRWHFAQKLCSENEKNGDRKLLSALFEEYSDIEFLIGDGNYDTFGKWLYKLYTQKKEVPLSMGKIDFNSKHIHTWSKKYGLGRHFTLTKDAKIKLVTKFGGPKKSNTSLSFHPFDELHFITFNDEFKASNNFVIPKGTTILAPSIFCYYLKDLKSLENAEKAISIAIDVASLALGAGALTVAIKAASGVVKVFRIVIATADIISSLANITLVAFENELEAKFGPERVKDFQTVSMWLGIAAMGGDLAFSVKDLVQYRRLKSALESATGNALSKETKKVLKQVVYRGDAASMINVISHNKNAYAGVLNLTNYAFKSGDDFFDIIIHADEAGNFIIRTEKGGIAVKLSASELGAIMEAAPENKKIRLLSCNDEEAAIELSNYTTREFYATSGKVEIFEDGIVRHSDDFKKYKNGEIISGKLDANPNVSGRGSPLSLGKADELAGVGRNADEVLSYTEKSKLFIKNENALLSYSRKDGTFFMQKSPSNKDLTTGFSDELTLSFKYKNGPNANSKDIFGKVAISDEGYIVANLKKPKGMTNQQIKGVTGDALDMALHHYGKNNVKGIKSTWVKNRDLYPSLPDNKSFNLTMFEDAMKNMNKSDAAFKTVTGKYAKSRGFNTIKEINEFTEIKDGFYGYEVIFGL